MTPSYAHLHAKWTHRELSKKEKILEKHHSAISWLRENFSHTVASSLGSLILFAFPGQQTFHAHSQILSFVEDPIRPIDNSAFLISDLSHFVPTQVQPLDLSTEKQVSAILSRTFQLDVRPDIHGLRLDRTYGYIGQEQHLARFPGDTIALQLTTDADMTAYGSYGMAPGLGAWGYFADSKTSMTSEDGDRERWYIAVQTFMATDFQNRFSEYRDFFKYRKMLVVNPNNGKAVVADIGDSGPAVWTGKQLGGSPEVMHYLERVDGAQKGGVLFYFINDPTDQVPLGPIKPAKDNALPSII